MVATDEGGPSEVAQMSHCTQQDTRKDFQSVHKTGGESCSSDTSQSEERLHMENTTEVLAKERGRSQVKEVLEQDELMTVDVAGTTTQDLYKILAEVDPRRADTLHPNNRRKIIR